MIGIAAHGSGIWNDSQHFMARISKAYKALSNVTSVYNHCCAGILVKTWTVYTYRISYMLYFYIKSNSGYVRFDKSELLRIAIGNRWSADDVIDLLCFGKTRGNLWSSLITFSCDASWFYDSSHRQFTYVIKLLSPRLQRWQRIHFYLICSSHHKTIIANLSRLK